MQEITLTNGQTKIYYNLMETKKFVIAALKHNFPTVKFSVTTKRYSGGCSMDICWQDGPRQTVVDFVIEKFAGAEFDGMQDLKSSVDSIIVGKDGIAKRVHFGVDYIFTKRNYSEAYKEVIRQNLKSEFGIEAPKDGTSIKVFGDYRNEDQLIWQRAEGCNGFGQAEEIKPGVSK